MARAGDGAPRSASRQREKIIRVRASAEEHARFSASACRGGHGSIASFLRDAGMRSASGPALPPWAIGELGIIGGALTAFAERAELAGRGKSAQEFRTLSTLIARMQRKLMQEDSDAGEDDPVEAARGGR